MSRTKKLALFRRGADAASRIAGTTGLYFCPVCMSGYEESSIAAGLLTLEHVPPKSAGGRGIALTCRSCNNSAGHTIDAAVGLRTELERFRDLLLHGTGELPVDAVLNIAGVRANVRLRIDESGSTVIELLKHSNDPQVLKQIGEQLERGSTQAVSPVEEMTVTARAEYHIRRAKVGDLRTAYLAAFASFGYRYAFHSRLNCVREQILAPDSTTIRSWSIGLNTTTLPMQRLAVLRNPPAVVVQNGQVGVFLPWINGPDDFYAHLDALYTPNERLNLSGRAIDWPKGLEMTLDFRDSDKIPNQQ